MKSKSIGKGRSFQPELLGLKKVDRARKFLPFGGSLAKGNPRECRPVSHKHAMHLILKSSIAKGRNALSHPGRRKQLDTLITNQAFKQGVRIYELSINSNHIHILLKPASHKAYSAFVRAISGLIARKVLRKERGSASHDEQTRLARQKAKGESPKLKFWDHRPFTRIVAWGRAFYEARFYVIQNHFESIGYLDYRPRHIKVSRLLI